MGESVGCEHGVEFGLEGEEEECVESEGGKEGDWAGLAEERGDG